MHHPRDRRYTPERVPRIGDELLAADMLEMVVEPIGDTLGAALGRHTVVSNGEHADRPERSAALLLLNVVSDVLIGVRLNARQ